MITLEQAYKIAQRKVHYHGDVRSCLETEDSWIFIYGIFEKKQCFPFFQPCVKNGKHGFMNPLDGHGGLKVSKKDGESKIFPFIYENIQSLGEVKNIDISYLNHIILI